MKPVWKSAAALMMALVLLLSGCAAKESPKAEEPAGEAADGILSEFAAMDLDGNEVTAETAFGGYDLVMINVWGTFCGPCIGEMPGLGEISDEMADKNIRVVGILSDALNYDGSVKEDILADAKEIVEKTGADYLHIVPSEDLYFLLYQIQSYPMTFFVDENGCQVGYAYAGARDKEKWMEIIEATLAEQQE